MNEQFGNLGKNLAATLQEKGISLTDLSNRDIVALRRALRGDFTKALESNAPLANEVVTSAIAALRPELKPALQSGMFTPNMLRRAAKQQAKGLNKQNIFSKIPNQENMPITPEQTQKLLEGMGKVWKDNRLTGNLSKAIDTRASERLLPGTWLPEPLKRLRKKGLAQKLTEAIKGEDTQFRKGLRSAGDVAGNAALITADPGTFGLNMVKRIADDHHIMPKLKPGRIVQENLQDFFVSQPMQNSFGKGLKGDYVTPFHINTAAKELSDAYASRGTLGAGKKVWDFTRETVDSQVFNPFTSAAKNLSNGIGKAIHDAEITQEQLARAASKGAKKYPVLEKFPLEPKPLSKEKNYIVDRTVKGAKKVSDKSGLTEVGRVLKESEMLRGSGWGALKEGLGGIRSLFM